MNEKVLEAKYDECGIGLVMQEANAILAG